uniref:Uncharacterized protein n=1 Tax=Timema cristinae TaxID=61476 RepID=A0A7R9H9D0_TIMCR|nr:unnamed protein product [Timema cristinae]
MVTKQHPCLIEHRPSFNGAWEQSVGTEPKSKRWHLMSSHSPNNPIKVAAGANMEIVDVSCRRGGSFHDAAIFKASEL